MVANLNNDNLITKSNKFIESAYKLTEVEQKIVLTLISLVQPSDKDFQSYTFSIRDFVKLIGGNNDKRYKQLEEITKKLMSKVYEIRLEDRLIQIQWLSQAEYNYRQGTVSLTLHHFFRPYLLELKKEFTTYQLKNVSKLKGHYSIRIYELLKQYERLKERTFTLDDLREKLGATDIYPAYANFKARVILPAQQQLSEKSDISFEFKEIKKGRSVNKIKFTIHPKNALLEPIPVVEEVSEAETETEIIDVPDIVNNDLFTILEEEDIKEIHRLTMDLGFKVNKKMIKNWLGYGKDSVIKALESIRGNKKIENPIGFISYKLQNGTEEEEFVQDDPADEAIREFIQENVPKQKVRRLEMLPNWMLKEKAIEKFKEYMDEEAAKILWDKKQEVITDEVNKKRLSMQY